MRITEPSSESISIEEKFHAEMLQGRIDRYRYHVDMINRAKMIMSDYMGESSCSPQEKLILEMLVELLKASK